MKLFRHDSENGKNGSSNSGWEDMDKPIDREREKNARQERKIIAAFAYGRDGWPDTSIMNDRDVDVSDDMHNAVIDGMIEGKINPKCIDISDQASHSFYNNELDIWFEPDEEIFPEGCGEWGLNGLIETNGISDDEVFDLLYEGANNYINRIYGKDWKEKYLEPKSK